MSGSSGKKIIAACLLAGAFGAVMSATHEAPVRVSGKPFMLFVTPLLPPEGRQRSEAFSTACYKEIKAVFDSTSFQAILLPDAWKVDKMSNQKKDIILTTDSLDCYREGPEFDTLVVWMRYRVGLLYGRADVPYPKGREADLPPLIASKVLQSIRNEFTGVVELEGGPAGMTITLTDGVTVAAPCRMMFPPGDYYIISQYPDFQTRTDTLLVFQGRLTKKRILLLPR
jgi:hypothetical protein